MNRSPSAPIRAFTRPDPDGKPAARALGVVEASGAPAGGPLDTYGDISSPSSRQAARDRYADRALLWLESTSRAVRACGRCKRKGIDRVEIRASEKGLGLSGLQHCASVWICPVCAATVWSERSLDIGSAAAVHIGNGGSLAMATFTTRHHAGDGLGSLVAWLRAGWKAVWDGKHGMKIRQALGLVGYVRVMEINYGQNGWHPHFHVALFIRPGVESSTVYSVLADAFGRWSSGVVNAGGKVPTAQAQDVRMFGQGDGDRLATYLTKSFLGAGPASAGSESPARGAARTVDQAGIGERLGREMTQGARKQARTFYGTTPVWGLLRNVRVDGCADSLGLWKEYEKATHHVRGIQWSRGLRKDLGLGDERDDQSIVDDDRGGEAVLALTEKGLARIIGWPELVPEMRFAWQDGGYAGLREFMDTNGVGYDVITEGNDGGTQGTA